MNISFEPITLEGQQLYGEYLALCPQKLSDYSFVNIWGWCLEYGLEWSFQKDCVLLRQTIPQTRYWAPVGDWTRIDWSAFRDQLPENACFTRVPEALKELWEAALPELHTHECRNHWDYVYDVRQLIDLKGKDFHKKKNLFNQFVRDVDFTFTPLTEKTVEYALALQTEWFLWRNSENDQTLDAENRAIVKVMHDWSRLDGLMGAGLMVEDKMIAYTIAEALDESQVVIHFEKGCPQFKGVYQAINRLFLENSCAQYSWVNREQDLGDEGLRKAKLSYNPVFFLKKFDVCLHGKLEAFEK